MYKVHRFGVRVVSLLVRGIQVQGIQVQGDQVQGNWLGVA